MAAVSSLPHPLLVGDIGGTNARFALVATPGGPVGPVWRTRTVDAPGPAEAIARLGASPRTVVLCTAGPVADRRCHLTNAHWVVDGPALAAALNLAQGLLLNDFEALALSLPALEDGANTLIGPELAPGGGPRLVLGPGTGLGVGALVEAGGRLAALASEAAHLDFAAHDMDAAVLARTARVDGRLTAEAVLSGPGLLRLHTARCELDGQASAVVDGVALVDAALAEPAGSEGRTVALFLRLL
ncbi:MAG: glucokinase, partial [Alsobacter sp.]